MRLPLSKPYRAFPELDKLTDAQCERLVTLAGRRHVRARVATTLIAITLAAITLPLALGLGAEVYNTLTTANQGAWAFLAGLAVCTACLMTGPACGYYLRDVWLRSAIRSLIHDASCVSCGYSLLGLPAPQHAIRCPECGSTTDTTNLGLDTLSPTPSDAPQPP